MLPSRLSLAAAVLTLASATPLFADETVKVEQPAPTAAYTAESPDYLHFKEIVITRKSKYSLDFDFLLQGKLPSKFDRDEGVRYKIYLDLQDFKNDQTEKTLPGFASDLTIAVFQNPRTSRFDSWFNVVRYGNSNYDIKITKVKASDDRLSFEARCELFGTVPAMKFVASSGRLFLKKGETSINDNGVQDTKVFDVPLPTGSGAAD